MHCDVLNDSGELLSSERITEVCELGGRLFDADADGDADADDE